MRRFTQVDVFTDTLMFGNPVAVVHDADSITDDDMAAFARWTNLSETTFLLSPTDERADYRLRIFTPGGELPFAGHPTLGSARAWLAAGNAPQASGMLVQECGAGLVRIRQDGDRLAFAAPPLVREGPVDIAVMAQITRALGIDPDLIEAANWVDNGPGWIGLLLLGAEDVLELTPDFELLGTLAVGVMGPYDTDEGGLPTYETRAFVPGLSVPEDPVTGSLAAGFATWLIGDGLAPDRYLVRQGTRLDRRGRIHVQRDGEIWIGGDSVIGVSGEVAL
ncbi:MAG TPA: PhzF family phenazine biosynthesis protein [Thermomicrobiales bacterium]|nr:PhzF family phenazine biosynthesis protein [Thermomicrobiales bacterium]